MLFENYVLSLKDEGHCLVDNPQDKIQRSWMVDGQVRPAGIVQSALISAMLLTPRQAFLSSDKKTLAYADCHISLGPDKAGTERYLLSPMDYARTLQAAEIKPGDRVLEVFGAPGYATRLAFLLGAEVWSVEQSDDVEEGMRWILSRFGEEGLHVVSGNPLSGYPAQAPYDVILVYGRLKEIPNSLLEQLKEGGRLITCLGSHPVSPLTSVTRRGNGWSYVRNFDVNFPEVFQSFSDKCTFVF